MKRLLIALCVVLLAAGSVFAAGTKESAQKEPAPELVIQLMSDAPVDKDMVTAEINKLLLKKLRRAPIWTNLSSSPTKH